MRLFVILIVGCLALLPALAADPAPATAATCVACHGADGNSVNPIWPNLAGQHASYLVAQLKAFKSGAREELSMTAMVAPLSDDDIIELADYYAGLQPYAGIADAELVELGAAIYRGGRVDAGVPACMACHGPSGAGNPPAGYPTLSGQHAAYTSAQLQLYKKGERSTDPAAMMRTIAARLSDEQIEAVASYIAGLN